MESDKIISEYKSQETFIDKYKFYKKNSIKLREIEISHLLMLAFARANKIIDDDRIKQRGERVGAVEMTVTKESIIAERYRRYIIYLMDKYYKEHGIDEPKPSNSFQHGQIIEYEVNQYSSDSFESLKDKFISERKDYPTQYGCDSYLQERLSTSISDLKNIEFYKNVDLVNLVRRCLKEDYINVDFKLLYEDFNRKKIEAKNEFGLLVNISEEPFYKNLAKVIPLILFINYLEQLKANPQNIAQASRVKSISGNISLKDIRIIAKFRELMQTNGSQKDVLGLMGMLKDLDVGNETSTDKDKTDSIRRTLKKHNEIE